MKLKELCSLIKNSNNKQNSLILKKKVMSKLGLTTEDILDMKIVDKLKKW